MADTIGPQDADWALVSRGPGKHDARNGEPFSGPSGRIVNYLLDKNGLDRKDVILTNTVLCYSEAEPPKEAIKCCAPRLEEDLKDVETILAGGSEAVREVLGSTINKSRGYSRTVRYGGRERRCVATFNPAFALREASFFPSIADDFRRAANPPREFRAPKVRVINTLPAAYKRLKELLDEPFLAIDTETTGRAPGSKLVCIGFSGADAKATVFGLSLCGGEYYHGQDEETVEAFHAALRSWFSEYNGKQLYHNGQFDTKILHALGIPSRVDEDTLLLSYACDERSGGGDDSVQAGGVHGLDYLTQNELEWPYYTPDAVQAGKKNGFRYDDLGMPFSQWDELYEYNGYDVCGSMQLHSIFLERAEKDDVLGRYRSVLIPGTNALAKVEARGIRLNVKKLEHIRDKEVQPKLVDISVDAGKVVGEPINLGSPKQCGEFLYGKLQVRDPLLNKRPGNDKKRSVDSKHREWISKNVTNQTALGFIRYLEEYSKLSKIRGTYLNGLLPFVGEDGRIRGNFLLFGTETSRLSARRPNLQNQPRTSDEDIARGEGYVNIRQLYQADYNGVFIAADYSQVELRTAAVLSGDTFLLTVYGEDRDLHDEMAASLFGSHFTSEQRVMAKAANFGCLFGIEAWYFGQLFGISTQAARKIIKGWWGRVPELRQWTEEVVSNGRKQGYVTTAFGHKRRFPLITDENVKHVLREMVNTPVQGTASDFTTCAIIDIEEGDLLEGMGTGVVIPLHDSINALADKKHQVEACAVVKEVMEAQPAKQLGWRDIPFTVEVKVGPDWGHVK